MFVEHKEAGEVTEAPAKTLKLSEAMRIGCLSTKPGRGAYYDFGDRACAWGAAAVGLGAAGYDEVNSLASALHCGRTLPQFKLAGIEFKRATGLTIMDANDHQLWTREAIVGWLESHGL